MGTKITKVHLNHLGTLLAHFLEMAFAAPRVVALCSSGMSFQTLGIRLEASDWYPGTGRGISFEFVALVNLRLVLSLKRH